MKKKISNDVRVLYGEKSLAVGGSATFDQAEASKFCQQALSAIAYAEKRGVDKALVSRWIADGTIAEAVTRKGRGYAIDAAMADRLLEERLSQPHRKKGKKKNLTLNEARTLKEQSLARLRELDLKEKTGDLIPRDQVEKEAFALARQVRDALLGIPDRISAQLAATKDRAAIKAILLKEITKALEAICK